MNATTRTTIGDALRIAVGDLPGRVTAAVRLDSRPGEGPWLYLTTMSYVVREVDDAMVEAFEFADGAVERAGLVMGWAGEARANLAAELRLVAAELAEDDERQE